jgi:hypothetical protein
MNEKVFENPEEMNPERFLKGNGHPEQVIPFGVGIRYFKPILSDNILGNAREKIWLRWIYF